MKQNRYWFRKNGPVHWIRISWEGWTSTLCVVVVSGIVESLIAFANGPLWLYSAAMIPCVIGFTILVIRKSEPAGWTNQGGQRWKTPFYRRSTPSHGESEIE